MIYIEQNQNNTIALTLTESATITAPTWLFKFVWEMDQTHYNGKETKRTAKVKHWAKRYNQANKQVGSKKNITKSNCLIIIIIKEPLKLVGPNFLIQT